MGPAYRFSGHETFPCRYAWLPKFYRAMKEAPDALRDDDESMVELGIGKNMVRAAKFWAQAVGIASQDPSGQFSPTKLGTGLFGSKGADQFLEDPRTLWLLHWQLCAHVANPIFAWDFMLNRWSHPEFTRSDVLRAFRDEALQVERELSDVTLEQHFDVFLHTYVPTSSRRVHLDEETLDCPLVELELIRRVGERPVDGGKRREPIYAFRREAKPEITSGLFAYCLAQFWLTRHGNEKTLPYRAVCFGHGSPGQVFKLPEDDVRSRLNALEADTNGEFSGRESATSQQISWGRREPVSLSVAYSEAPALAN
jgi:hypothetical protein